MLLYATLSTSRRFLALPPGWQSDALSTPDAPRHRAQAVKAGRRPPPKAARSGLDGQARCRTIERAQNVCNDPMKRDLTVNTVDQQCTAQTRAALRPGHESGGYRNPAIARASPVSSR